MLKIDGTTGDATFSGKVTANALDTRFMRVSGRNILSDHFGLQFGSTLAVIPCDANQTNTNGVSDLGLSAFRFKDAYFSGTVDAAGFTVNGSPISGGGGGDPLELTTGGIAICQNTQSRGEDYKTEPVIELESAPMHGGTTRHTGVMLSAAMTGGWATGEFRVQVADTWGSYSSAIALKVGQNGCTAPDFIATSDERAKDNITTAPVGLIDSLKGREWDWKESGEKGSGVVAQELEQVLPHLVHEDDEGMKSVSYNGLVAYLIEEVKALRAEVEVLKNG